MLAEAVPARVRRRWPSRVFGSLLILLGLPLAIGGVRLVLLHGSAYYVVAGVALTAIGVQFWRLHRDAALAYWLFLLATIVWSVWEAGLYPWALMPRLALFLILGLWLVLPPSMTGLRLRRRRGLPTYRGATALLCAAAAVVVGLVLHVATGNDGPADPVYARGIAAPVAAISPRPAAAGSGDWRTYGNDLAGSRFSSLSQINTDNVPKLAKLWEYRVGPGVDGRIGGLEVTPLKVGNSLYICTAYNDVIAIDAESGTEKWHFRSNIDRKGLPYNNCRGVAYHEAPNASGDCVRRIVTATMDGRLLALDAANGQPCRTFGYNGAVSLLEGMGAVPHQYYLVSSAPTIVRNTIVIGGFVADNQSVGEPSGVIRGFDVTTGKLAWAFDVGRLDRQTAPPPGEHYTLGTPNSWAPMSGDEALGLVFAPMGGATPDYFGGLRRPFDDRFSGSVVAIDVRTGKPRWSFQAVRHDLWDYDVASQPTLVDLPGEGGATRKLLVLPTKSGQLFLLDRVTGKPAAEVAERPVPHDGVPGEHVSPTQPFSVGMPSLVGPPLSERKMWGITPFDQLWCRIAFRSARYEGPFTPPNMTRNISYPGFFGGMDWGSASIDTDRHLLIINSNRMAAIDRLLTRAEADRRGLAPMTERNGVVLGAAAAQKGTPYGADVQPFMSPLFVPCQQPPFGMLTAIDLKSRKVVWTRPLGTSQDSGPLNVGTGLPLPLGGPNVGGSVVTRGGLTFIGASHDAYLRAYNTATGKLLWKSRLPAGGNATPMTYRSNASGRQIVVIAASGHYGLMNRAGNYIIAYALPR
ncbi:membrane-bound PQQ-dependent dehydrogenase, glucose/quinate/shikimate family [Sphingomonas sp.]|uniref:membrane-bound PQQ-dependent dehydrogenase, glucose/quinate/shikimate family n=1 Tax=Sphingomonas sp. TaxID=28214 RepID=UPI003AFF7D31